MLASCSKGHFISEPNGDPRLINSLCPFGKNFMRETFRESTRRPQGWSYGGYMSAMALARAPETFHVGIAGAPVTHWDGYDTHYTERYMGAPQTNAEGYLQSSVMAHVDKIEVRPPAYSPNPNPQPVILKP